MDELQELSKESHNEILQLGFQPIAKAVDQCYANIIAGKKGERIVFPTKWKKLKKIQLKSINYTKKYTRNIKTRPLKKFGRV